MPGDRPLDFLPLWGVFVATLLLVLLSVEAGYRFGRYRRGRSEKEKEAPIGEMVGAMLGLLAFMLAFTFGLAAARFDSRRQALLDETNAIGTSYLRAGLLPEPYRTEVRKLLREYVEVRLEAVRSGDVKPAVRRSEELHGLLWAQATAVGEKNPGSIVVGLFIQSLNEVIDLHSKRVTVGLRNRIPGTIWAALYAVAVLAVAAMGYHGGLAGAGRSLAILAVAFTFSVVLWVIADLDRPMEGWLEVSPQAMIDLRNSMTEPAR
jgi:hypothetical protein